MSDKKRQSAIDRFYNGKMRASDGPILVDELLRDNGALRNDIHQLRAQIETLKSEKGDLQKELVEVCELFIVQHRYLKLKGAIVGPSPAVDDAQAILDREKEGK